MSNILYTPIQINGELSRPVDSSTLNLLERELFIDNQGNLYFGNMNGTATQINADKANVATLANNLGSNNDTFILDNINQTGKLGSVQISHDKEQMLSTFDGLGTILKQFQLNSSNLNNCRINSVQTMTLSEGKDKMWGTELPTDNLQHGRIFFLVSEE